MKQKQKVLKHYSKRKTHNS